MCFCSYSLFKERSLGSYFVLAFFIEFRLHPKIVSFWFLRSLNTTRSYVFQAKMRLTQRKWIVNNWHQMLCRNISLNSLKLYKTASVTIDIMDTSRCICFRLRCGFFKRNLLTQFVSVVTIVPCVVWATNSWFSAVNIVLLINPFHS